MSALNEMAKDVINDDKPLRAIGLATIAIAEELRAANEINKGHVDYIQRMDQRPGVQMGHLILAATDAISTMLREAHAGDEAYEEKRPPLTIDQLTAAAEAAGAMVTIDLGERGNAKAHETEG